MAKGRATGNRARLFYDPLLFHQCDNLREIINEKHAQ
jgi:hypothetical protein